MSSREEIQRRLAREELTLEQAAFEWGRLHRRSSNNLATRFLLRLAIGVVVLVVLVMLLRSE